MLNIVSKYFVKNELNERPSRDLAIQCFLGLRRVCYFNLTSFLC